MILQKLSDEIYQRMERSVYEQQDAHPDEEVCGQDLTTDIYGISFCMENKKISRHNYLGFIARHIEIINSNGEPLPNINQYLNRLEISYE